MDSAKLLGARILMVDDQVANTCLTTNFLNRIGYSRLRGISDSTLVLAEINTFKPDLILLDLSMPGLDGFQVLDQMRQNTPSHARVPVLVITGDATAVNKRRALAAGATDLLAKPFDPSEMNMRVRNILEARFLRLEIETQNRLLEERVTERTAQLQRACDDIQAAQRQLVQQERLSAFAEMAGGVVHDFSNALMAVIGYSDMLICEGGLQLDDRKIALEYLSIINTAGRDASEVVSRLRDFYRPRCIAESQVMQLEEVVRQAVMMTQPKWKDSTRPRGSGINVEMALSDLPAMRGNPAELREMITNLIFNAVDAMPDGGTLTLRTFERDGNLLLEVSDTGSGMTPEVRGRCLDPFFSTKGEKGTGLGLAMVFGIVQRQQGNIDIDSAPGLGTTFRITLPAVIDRIEIAPERLETTELLAANSH